MSEIKDEFTHYFISECSLTYPKLVQMSEIKDEFTHYFISECSLTYPKLVQMSEIKDKTFISIYLTHHERDEGVSLL